MLQKKEHLAILARKPDIFGSIPPAVLDEQTAAQLTQIPRLAVAELAGPADVSALFSLMDHYRPDGLLPTISYTGTEYGDWIRMGRIAAGLKKRVEKELNIFVAGPVLLGSPGLWTALVEGAEGGKPGRFGFASRCLGCRVYSFMLRVPLCRRLDARYFIPSPAGLRERGCPAELNAVEKKYLTFLMAGYGVDVWYHDPHLEDGDGHGACLACVLAPQGRSGAAPEKLTQYFEKFALPAAGGILSRAVFGAAVDYARCIPESAPTGGT